MENRSTNTSAIIVASGNGLRMNNKIRKQYLLLGGMPILCRTLQVFITCQTIDTIFLVVPEDDIGYCKNNILAPLNPKKNIIIVPGGPSRQESVYNGLQKIIGNSDTVVLIHDGVRPFVTHKHIEACIDGARKSDACILGIPAYDTLKRVTASGFIEKTLARETVWLAQTPQAFKYFLIEKVHANAKKYGYTGTDDASLAERLGVNIKIINGSRSNIKITTREDLNFSKSIFQAGGL